MEIQVNNKNYPLIRSAVIFLKIILAIIILLFSAGIILGSYLTIKSGDSPHQAEFIRGTVPNSLPDGFYAGTSDLPVGSWIGKRFDAQNQTGVNIFKENGQEVARYSFKMSVVESIRDQGLKVIRIDYNLPNNPLWLRPAIDEIVQITPGKLLGKADYRYSSNNAFTIGYFQQSK